ncbi:hypothetical protein PPYR_02007 [Photinus pyralis]|uniref:Cytochrome P450 n=1 Tax=Photinus pyralis TaxID=7054 RepID=A0A5N4B5Z4_PHOPY|nr:cytochrome P450 6a2-like [Photinus pyralis]KAB0805037.1 hypothetical protein PPYR_02007 [Photinus pyralis]
MLLLLVFIVSIVVVYVYFKWNFTYWKRRKVPFINPSIPFGTAENPFARKEYIGHRIQKYYTNFKAKGWNHVGLYFFSSPSYLPIHPDYIRNIMSKHFRYFTDRGTYANEKGDPLSAHLFNLEGEKWGKLRKKLTPTFTSGKIKLMFPTLVRCSETLVKAIGKSNPIEAKELLGCFTTDVIGSCAFGVECDSFANPDSEFRRYGKSVFTTVIKGQTLASAIAMVNPGLAQWLNIKLIPNHITQFFMKLVHDTVSYRETNALNRRDFMQILIDLKNSKSDDDRLSIEEMAANTFVFFLAGFETSSTTMAFCLYELAKNPAIQDTLRQEISAIVEKHQAVTYEAVTEMKYLSQVLDETLRKYPPAPLIPRVCVEDYQIPGSDATIGKGTRIYIPVFALHHDPEYFPNPEEFVPARFSDENSIQRHPYVYLPFGEGPRICIGARFGLMQAKVGLIALLRKFAFRLHEKTGSSLQFDPTNLIPTAKDGIWLNAREL